MRCSLAISHDDESSTKTHTDLQLGRKVHHGPSSFSSLAAALGKHVFWRRLLWALDRLGLRLRGISTEARSLLLEPVLVPPHLGRRPRAAAPIAPRPAMLRVAAVGKYMS